LKHPVAVLASTTTDKLKKVLLQAWDTIPMGTIEHLCQDFATRLRLWLELEGHPIRKLLWECEHKNAAMKWNGRVQVLEL
jgi:hypothetical protein